jgi:cell division protein FtsB
LTRRRKSIIPRILIVLFAIYFSVTYVRLQIQISDKKQQLADLSAAVEQQRRTNAELQSLLSDDIDEAYVAKIAKEKLGYGLPNEQVYVDVTGN